MVVAFPHVWRVSSQHGVQTFSLSCLCGSCPPPPPFLASSLKPFLIKEYSALMSNMPNCPLRTPTSCLSFPPQPPGGGGGVLPYITYTCMCRPMGSWFWSSWFRTGYPFQRRFLERGIILQTHESSSFVSSHLKLCKDRLLLKIGFNALTSKLLYSCCTLEQSIKNWPISRTGYQF